MQILKNHIPIILALGLTAKTDKNGLTRNAIAKRMNKQTSSIYKAIKPLEKALLVKVSREYPHPYTGKICKDYILSIRGIIEYLNLQSLFMQNKKERKHVLDQISNTMKNYANIYNQYPIFSDWSEIERVFGKKVACPMIALSAELIKGEFSIPYTFPKHSARDWRRVIKSHLRSKDNWIQDLTMMFFGNITISGHERFDNVSETVKNIAEKTIEEEKEKLRARMRGLNRILQSLA